MLLKKTNGEFIVWFSVCQLNVNNSISSKVLNKHKLKAGTFNWLKIVCPTRCDQPCYTRVIEKKYPQENRKV